MPTLYVRSVPVEIYERLQKLARAEQRSLSAQVISLLDSSLREADDRKAQSRILRAIRRRRFTPPAGTPISVKLLREDRGR